ncbi:hypothetical protein EDD86DRAFT_248303 [Gorgonomyces haynaldii]|nr:hypothetical protein EDD86DRAFT_248303 [Gorgonomyces haynaldii]
MKSLFDNGTLHRWYYYVTIGTYLYVFPGFINALDYFALLLVIGVMLTYIFCMIRLWPDLRLGKFYAKALYATFICCLLWNTFKLIYVYSDSPPWVNWAYSSLGLISQSMAVLIDGEILKAFSAISKVLTAVTVRRMQYTLLVLHLIMAGGTYIRVFYIGGTFPDWLVIWYRYGYVSFIILTVFSLARVHYHQRKEVEHMQQSSALTVEQPDEEHLSSIMTVIGIMMSSLVLLLTGGALFAWDFFNYKISSINVQIISNTISTLISKR